MVFWLNSLNSWQTFHKNKGDTTDPKDHRPFTLISCFGKLLKSNLNERLNQYAYTVKIILYKIKPVLAKTLLCLRSYFYPMCTNRNI